MVAHDLNRGIAHGAPNPRSASLTNLGGSRAAVGRATIRSFEPRTHRSRCRAAAGVAKPNKAALADLTGSILSSLRNHKGNGIQRTNEGSPARWRLAPN